MGVWHCTPDEAARRCPTWRQAQEIMTYYEIKRREDAQSEKRAKQRVKAAKAGESAERAAKKYSREK